MSPEEKAEAIPRLRQAGNELYAQGKWFDAAAKYEEALNLIDQLSLTEKPGDPEHQRLDAMRVPFYVNMAQCQFKLKVRILISTSRCFSFYLFVVSRNNSTLG